MPVKGCDMPNQILAKGCAVVKVPFDLGREVTRRVGTVMCRPFFCDKEFGLHTHTVKDELQTICNRHLMETPEPDVTSLAWKYFRRRMCWLSRQVGRCRSASIAAVLKGKTGRRKKRFFRGIQELNESNNIVTKKDARIKEMQKLEMYEVDKIPIKEDRGIQFRSVKYNVALARELHNVEAKVIGLHIDDYHPVMKGATPEERAVRIALGAKSFKKPLYLLADHKRFDAHVHLKLLKQEHAFYLRCRRSGYLKKLLKMQRRNKGVSAGGIRYVTEGKRMSGDINTGLGNTVLNMCILFAWLDASGVKGKVYLDGDDSVIIIEEEDRVKLLPLDDFMRNLGMVTEMEATTDFFKVEFCQSRPVIVDGVLRFVRNPHKILATVGQSAEKLDFPVGVANVRASCLCELAMNGNCPVIGPYCRRLYEACGPGGAWFNAAQLWKAEQYGIKFELPPEKEPDDESRYSFYRAWGLDHGLQLAYENQDIIFADEFSKAKRIKVRQRDGTVDTQGFEWTGVHEAACDCGLCPEYNPGGGR